MDHTKSAKNARPTIKLADLNLTPIFVALLVVLVSIGNVLLIRIYFVVYFTNLSFAVLYFLWKKKSQKRTDILLTGLCESGKTSIFSQLLHNELRETFTSIAENIGHYVSEDNGQSVRVIDIPGHERLRGRFYDQYKKSAKAIVFVVDSVTVPKDVRDVAEYVLSLTLC